MSAEAGDANPTGPPQPAMEPTNDERNLVVSFVYFVRHKLAEKACSDEQQEALEVAIQCLESAFRLSDASYAYQPARPLLETFKEADESKTTSSANNVEQANRLKEEGNELMKREDFEAAVQKYNDAIRLARDPVFFCNRAAAYCRLDQYELAVQDCRTAIALDANYSKAYGRLGLALSCQHRYPAAVEAYKKAIELDPAQESYKNNLKIAEDKLAEEQQRAPPNPFAAMFGGGLPGALGGGAGGGGPGGMPDFGAMFNNPAMMQLANQLMGNPEVIRSMESAMQGAGGLGDLFQAGHQLAQQLQTQHPELIEQLRNQFGGPGEGGGGGGDNNNAGGGDGAAPPPAN